MDFSQMTAEELYQYGIDNPDTPHASELVDALLIIDSNEAAMLKAGRYWSDSVYSEKIFDELIKYAKYFHIMNDTLAEVASIYKHTRYDKRNDFDCSEINVVNNIVDNIPKDILDEFILRYTVSISCYDHIIDKIINRNSLVEDSWVEFLKKKDGMLELHSFLNMLCNIMSFNISIHCCYIAAYWPDDRYKKEVVDYIVEIKRPDILSVAGVCFSDDRYDDRIKEALISLSGVVVSYIQCNYYIVEAIACWPKHRCDERMFDCIMSDCADHLVEVLNDDRKGAYYYGSVNDEIVEWFDFGEEKFDGENVIYHIIKRLPFTDKLKLLYHLGLKLTNDRFIPQIGRLLYQLDSCEYIEKARDHWAEDRSKHICKGKIIVDY